MAKKKKNRKPDPAIVPLVMTGVVASTEMTGAMPIPLPLGQQDVVMGELFGMDEEEDPNP